YTQADIDALGLEISVGGKKYPPLYHGQQDKVKKLVEINKGGADAIL
ncbi:hypothetical protein LCGC14_1720960, partial [marine sediment metagenome]